MERTKTEPSKPSIENNATNHFDVFRELKKYRANFRTRLQIFQDFLYFLGTISWQIALPIPLLPCLCPLVLPGDLVTLGGWSRSLQVIFFATKNGFGSLMGHKKIIWDI
jgi:hypothetical protein